MKKLFEEPILNILCFTVEDIITTSPGDFSDNSGPFEGEDDVFDDFTF